MTRTPIEEMSAEEIMALDGYGLTKALAEVIAVVSVVGRAIEGKLVPLAVNRAKAKLEPAQEDRDFAWREALLIRAELDELKERARTIREIKSALQSLIRQVPG